LRKTEYNEQRKKKRNWWMETAPATPQALHYEGFTEQQLKSAFAKVKKPEDWKAEIKAPVAVKDLSVTVAAIRFYTATDPVITASVAVMGNGYDSSKDPEGCYYIYSQGYRMGPAGDH
jgi:hypothetical protein